MQTYLVNVDAADIRVSIIADRADIGQYAERGAYRGDFPAREWFVECIDRVAEVIRCRDERGALAEAGLAGQVKARLHKAAITASQHNAVAKPVCKAHARLEILVLRILHVAAGAVQVRVKYAAASDECGCIRTELLKQPHARVGRGGRNQGIVFGLRKICYWRDNHVRIEATPETVCALGDRELKVPAKTEVERQFSSRSPVILKVNARILLCPVGRGVGWNRSPGRHTEQERCQIMAHSGSGGGEWVLCRPVVTKAKLSSGLSERATPLPLDGMLNSIAEGVVAGCLSHKTSERVFLIVGVILRLVRAESSCLRSRHKPGHQRNGGNLLERCKAGRKSILRRIDACARVAAEAVPRGDVEA